MAPKRFRRPPFGVMAGKPAVNIKERWIGKEDSVAVKGTFRLATTAEDPMAAAENGDSEDTETTDSESSVVKMDSLFSADPNEIVRRRLLIDGDGAGDEKKLTKVTQLYVLLDSEDDIDPVEMEKTYKSFVLNCKNLATNALKTVHTIEVNEKAKDYWMMVMNRIAVELNSHRILVAAQREKLAELKLTKQRNVEASNAVKLLDGTTDRKTSEQIMAVLKAQCEELEEKNAELDALISSRKQLLNHLCALAKRLTDEKPEVVEQAVIEAEERVLSDVSVDLD